jgi:hypothetical protein
MNGLALLLLSLLGAGGLTEYARSLGARSLDQPTLDAESYGEKTAIKREEDGLVITLSPRAAETGWKTPQQLRIGGDFTISAGFLIKKLPKPAQEDGVAIGLAIAFQDITQPDVTLVRLVEPKGADVYRAIEKPANNPMQMQMPMNPRMRMRMGMMQQPGAGNAAKQPRHTFPAAGDSLRLELEREGTTIRYQVTDAKSARPRYLGQVTLGPMDVMAVKLFATNRNGAEAVNVLLRELTIHADRIMGLGTMVRTVFNQVFYADPTSIENGVLIVGGQPKTPPGAAPAPAGGAVPPGAMPGAAPARAAARAAARAGARAGAPAPVVAPAAAPVATPAPAPAAAPAPAPVAGGAAAVKGQFPVGTAVFAGPVTGGAGQPPPQPPKAKIPLDELDSIRFERAPTLTARLMGQPNLDYTMPGLSAKKPDAAPKAAEATGAVGKADDKKAGAPEKAEAMKKNEAPKGTEKKTTEKKAADTKAAEKKAGDTKAADTKATEKKAADTKPTEKKAGDMKAADTKATERKAADTKPAEKKAGETKAADTKATEKKAVDTKATEKKAADTKASEKKAADTKATEKKADESDDVLAPPPGTTITRIPKVEPKQNGIRDMHIWVFGLRDAKIKQVTVNCQTDKGPAGWRLDTTDSQDWPLVIRRAGNDMSADLFLEPPEADCFEKDFMIMINYEDGQAVNAQAKAGKHTDPKLGVDPKAASVPPTDAWVYLTGDEKLFGKLESISAESLRLTTPWEDHLDIPLARIRGVHLGVPERKELPNSFARRLKERGAEDQLLAQAKNGEVIAISGVVEGTDNDRLRFRYQDRSRTLPLKLVEGLVLAARPEREREGDLRPTFSLPGGVAISGRWKDLDTSVWKIETPWGQELKLPAGEIQDVRFRGGKMTYLSDLSPSKVEEVPYFGHRLPWRRDVNLMGEPLKMQGHVYDRGLAVHSRCILTYDLDRRYSTFEALVGFDDAAKGKGRVDCRVFADGKALYANPDLAADGPPVKLAIPVAGAEQLRLSVDFGRGQDTGDRVIWANARLYRESPVASPAPKPAGRAMPAAQPSAKIGSR